MRKRGKKNYIHTHTHAHTQILAQILYLNRSTIQVQSKVFITTN